eukprot:GEMP01005221.1.p1 GENE.GEMP01005221.1~~GEMP01005221.1.p1  ORF type:complete len:958 (+),score=139.67 GEMP01005221.1:274-3147(+)
MATGTVRTLLPSMAPGQGIFATLGPTDMAQLQMGGTSPGGGLGGSPTSTGNPKALLHSPSNRQMLIDKMVQAPLLVCSGNRDCECRQCTAQALVRKDQVYHIGVPKAHLLEWATEKHSEKKSCLGASYYIIALLVFSVFFGMRTDLTESRGVDDAIRSFLMEKVEFDDPPESLRDVVTIEDFYSWLRVGLIPALHPETKPVSQKPSEDSVKFGNHSDATSIDGNFLRFNTILGGFTIYQHYNAKMECTNIPKALQYFSTEPVCYPDQSIPIDWYNELKTKYIDYADTVPGLFRSEYRSVSSTERDKAMTDLDYEVGVTIGNTRYFHYGMTAAEMDMEAQVMEFGDDSTTPWITKATRQIVVSFLSFNSEFGLWTMTRVDFFTNRAGKIHKIITNSFARVIIYPDGAQGVLLHTFELGWACLCVLPILFQLIAFIIKTVRKMKRKASPTQHYGPCAWMTLHLIRFIKTFLGNMDFVCFVVAFFPFYSFQSQATRLHAGVELLQEKNSLLRNDAMTKDGLADWFTFHDTYLDLDTGLWSHSDGMRSFCAIYVLVVSAMILRQLHRHPRLSFVTRTLTVISWDLFHFLIVTSIVFFSFTLAAQALYGAKDRAFSTFHRASGSLFRATFGADIWDTFVDGGYFTATSIFFYGSYHFLIILLVINMVLAMVMDSYAEIQRTTGVRKHIIASTWELIIHEMNAIRGHATGFSTILRELKTMGVKNSADANFDNFNQSETRRKSNTDEDLITVDVLHFSFPKMRTEEAEQLLLSVVHDQDEKRKAHAGVNLWKEVSDIREAVQILLQSTSGMSTVPLQRTSVGEFKSIPNFPDSTGLSDDVRDDSSNAWPAKKAKKDRERPLTPRRKPNDFQDFDLTKKAAFKWRPSTTSPASLGRTIKRIRQKEEDAQRRNLVTGLGDPKMEKKLKKEKKERERALISPRGDRQLRRAKSDLPKITGPSNSDR